MTAALAQQSVETPPAAVVLKLRAEVRALRWAEGEIITIPDAVDPLQEFAETSGLVLEIGQDAVQQILADAFLPYREAEWAAEAEIDALEYAPIEAVYCDTCGSTPCVNPSFCQACRAADARLAAKMATAEPTSPRPTPQTTVDAILWCVRERGLAALNEPRNVERLASCDADAKAQINSRIEKLLGAAA